MTILLVKAASIAVEQTTGTWTSVPAETDELRAMHVGRLISVTEVPDHEFELPPDTEERQYVFRIAFPVRNLGGQIPLLLSSVIGNISMIGKLKLVDLEFPPSFTKHFQGPRFGIEGVRKLLKVPKRPLVNVMIKPCTGLSPAAGAELFEEAALGGVDIVKDDELIGNVEYSKNIDRVKLFMAKEKRVFEATGEHTLYTVNVTRTAGPDADAGPRSGRRRRQCHHGQLPDRRHLGNADAGRGRRRSACRSWPTSTSPERCTNRRTRASALICCWASWRAWPAPTWWSIPAGLESSPSWRRSS